MTEFPGLIATVHYPVPVKNDSFDTITWRRSFLAPIIDCIGPFLPPGGAAPPRNGSILPGYGPTGGASRGKRSSSEEATGRRTVPGSGPASREMHFGAGETACSTHMMAPPTMNCDKAHARTALPLQAPKYSRQSSTTVGLDTFTRDSNNHLQQAWYTGGTWNGLALVSTTATLLQKPGAVSWGSGRIDVFMRGTDNNLWQTYYDTSGDSQWHWAEPLNQTIFSGPTVSSWGSGRLDVFFKGSAGDLLHQWYDSANGGWHAVESLGGQIQ